MRSDLTKNVSTVLDRKEMDRIPDDILHYFKKCEQRFKELKMVDKQTETEGEKEFFFFSFLRLLLFTVSFQNRQFFFCEHHFALSKTVIFAIFLFFSKINKM